MSTHDGIHRLLRPRSIAVVGGGFWCANVIEQCRKIGFKGDLWSVHPTRNELSGVPAFPTVADLPDTPDASFIGVNREATIDTIRALSARGAGGAVCFASGFQEAQTETGNGHVFQKALLDAAGDMTILGPNCYGFLNYLDGVALWPDQHGGMREERGVALLLQSSNIALNLTMQDRGLPLAYTITLGNQAQTGMADVGRALLHDDRVTALGLFIEGIDDPRRYEILAAEAHACGKPIVAMKIGKSDQAQAATISHTASLAGSDVGAQALLQRLGIGLASSLPVFLETLKLLHVVGRLPSNRIVSLSCSGGEASLMADTVHGNGLVLPPLNAMQEAGLRAALGPNVALANPLDYHTYIWRDVASLTATFTAMMQGDLAMGCVVLDFPRADRCDPAAWEPVVDAVDAAQRATGRPLAILASLKETMPEDTARRLIARGIVPFAGLPEAVEAMKIAAALCYVEADPLLLAPAPESPRTLSEADAKTALAAQGLRVPAADQATSPKDAAKAAQRIGFPVVLKGEGIAHKTEADAVVLGLTSPAAVEHAAIAMTTQSFLIEEMVTDTVAELLVGVVADPAHGYVLTLAAGGTLTELLEDSASLLVPAAREAVNNALQTLKIAKLLNGYRGTPTANLEAVLDAVMVVQAYVAEVRPQEVEINPLMCGPTHAIVADALIRLGD